jgi:hypothetical protein
MRLVTYNNDNEFKFVYMGIAKMFYLTGTAWDELSVKTENTKLFRGKHWQGEFFIGRLLRPDIVHFH